jgi:hypothetical protein
MQQARQTSLSPKRLVALEELGVTPQQLGNPTILAHPQSTSVAVADKAALVGLLLAKRLIWLRLVVAVAVE